MQSPPVPCCLIPLRPEYLPQHPIFKHPQPIFFPQCDSPSSHPYKTRGKIIVLYILIFKFFYLYFIFTFTEFYENWKHRLVAVAGSQTTRRTWCPHKVLFLWLRKWRWKRNTGLRGYHALYGLHETRNERYVRGGDRQSLTFGFHSHR